ncbi:MAG: glutathione S-transferase family protein [Proteobacteria bacterium]|nr:glutathione S-transferase family protein [Pseudomonadota bacterium]
MDLVLYGAALSPFVRKVEVVLREKGLDFEMENINMPFPDWYKEISPARRMPALRDRDISAEGPEGVIPDSSAICAYLERLHPEPAFYPKDAYEHGRAVWYEEYADSELAGCVGMGIFRPIVFPIFAKQDPDIETAKKTVKERLPRFLDYLEGELQGREYLVGDAFSIADLSVVTQLCNLELAVGQIAPDGWPELTSLRERVKSRPGFGPNLAICKKILKQPVDLGL